MSRDVQVSSVRPFPDESLLSFLQRAQAAGCVTDDKFHSWIAGAPIDDVWLAERRLFDWKSVSRFVNATAEELHGMSQRSLFYSIDDERRSGQLRQRAPWLHVAGHSAHCRCCFKESTHWPKSWLGPDSLVCERHGTVLLRHCGECGKALDTLKWTQVRPICPNCHTHLSLGPVVKAPPKLFVEAMKIQERYRRLLARAPVRLFDFELTHFAAVWRTARLFGDDSNGLGPVRDEILALQDIGPVRSGNSAEDRAIRHIQNVIVAHLLVELEPKLGEHFWFSIADGKELSRADDVIRFKVREIAESLAISLTKSDPVAGQLTISYASWAGSNGMPKAA